MPITREQRQEIRKKIEREGWEDTPLGDLAQKHDLEEACQQEQKLREEIEGQDGDDTQREITLLDDDRGTNYPANDIWKKRR